MVRKPSFLQKPAFTMIELIFAIVIIAITVVSLPMMTQVNASGIEKGYIQEAIFASSAEVHQALSYRWDANSTPDGNAVDLSQVIDVSNLCHPTRKRMPGHAARRCLNDLTIPVANNHNHFIPNINNATDLKNLFLVNTSDHGKSSGYKNQALKLNLVVTHPATFHLISNPNIKRIDATVIDGTDVVVKLYSYSFNIGEVDPMQRSF